MVQTSLNLFRRKRIIVLSFFPAVVTYKTPVRKAKNKVSKVKKGGKDQESIQSSTTLDSHLTQNTTWESNKHIIKHNKQEPRGQPFPSR